MSDSRDPQRPGPKRSSVFGSSSNIFGHRQHSSHHQKNTNEIKNSAPRIHEDVEEDHLSKEAKNDIKAPAQVLDSASASAVIKEESHESLRPTLEDDAAKPSRNLTKETQLSDTIKPTKPIEKEADETIQKTKDSTTKAKASTSFASYMSNAKKRKQEIEDMETKRLEDAKSQVTVDSSATEAVEELAKGDKKITISPNEDKKMPGIAAVQEQEVQPKPEISDSNIIIQDSMEIPETQVKSEIPDNANEKQEEHNGSPISTLSSELSILPSSSSADKQDPARTVHIPPRIPESDSDSSEGDLTQTPRNKNGRDEGEDFSIAEDSDADTIHGDSPQKPRRGRLVRKSDMHSDNSERKSDAEYLDHDTDSYHKKLRMEKLGRRSLSKSVSPQRHVATKRSKLTRDSSGRLRLQRACDKGKYEEANQLIEEGADVNDQDYAGNSALHEAALKGYTDIVELLLENGAAVNLCSGPDDKDTPLIDAASNGHIHTVEVLLKHGADPRIQNIHGQNAMDCFGGDNKDIPYLRKLLKDATIALKSKEKKRDQSRNTSDLDESSYDEDRSYSRSKSRSQRRPPRNDLLLVDFTTRHGRDEVYSRASDGDVQFVGTYLENGGKPDSQALALAAKFGHTEVVNLFLAFGAEVDLPDDKGFTPLMQTVGRGHIDTVKLLLQAGANPSKVSKDKKSVLDIATDSLISEEEEIKLIKDALADSGLAVENKSNNDAKKKRKVSVNEEDTHEVKKKKHQSNKQHERTSTFSNEATKFKEHHLETEKSKLSETSKVKPAESKPSAPKHESMKRSQSDDKSLTKASPKALVKPPKQEQQHETEEEKQAKLLKEKEALKILEKENALKAAREKEEARKREEREKEEAKIREEREKLEAKRREEKEKLEAKRREEREREELKKREEYEAIIAAKKKAREQEFLSAFDSDEKKKEEELKKLAELQAERKLKEAQENEARLKMEEETKIIMSQKEEIDKRRKIRNSYPYGLKMATFGEPRTKEKVLSYLPLYFLEKDGVRYCVDLQVILLLGVENIYQKYETLKSSRKMINKNEKSMLFNYFYPFLGNFSFRSTSKQMDDQEEELQKFYALNINWINYEDVLKIIQTDFNTICDVIITRTQQIDFQDRQPPTFSRGDSSSSGVVTPKGESEPASRKVSSSFAPFSKKLPILLRKRSSVIKSLSKNKKLW